MAKAGDYVELIAPGSRYPDAYGRLVGADNETDPMGSSRVWVNVTESLSLFFNVGRVSVPLSVMERVIPDGAIPEWRCTRPSIYGPTTPGHLDPKARQGHYIKAMTLVGAHQQMEREYPEDKKFDVEPWKRVSWQRVGNGKRAETKLLRAMFLEEAKRLHVGDHVFLELMGGTYSVKVNGAPKLWKTRPNEIRIPYKYGLYKFGYIDHDTINNCLVHVEVQQ